MSVLNGPGEGTWSVFAGQVVEERDALREKVVEQAKRIADLRRALDAAQERVRELQDCGQDGPCVLSPGCQHHFLEHTRTLLAEAEERGAKWAIDERGLHAKRDTRPMARELCERMRRSR